MPFSRNRWGCQASSLLIGIALGCLTLASCGAARTNHFRQFTQAGVAYSDAVGTLLDETGDAAIAADSMVLVKTRPSLSREERQQAILEHNQLLRERLALLQDLKRHARLLRAYFEALGALAESDAPSGIGAASEGVVAEMGKLHPAIANAKIRDVAVSSFVGSVTTIVVGRFKAAALEKELQERAPIIERELDLQQAALSAVARQLRTDLQAQLLQQESNVVVLPYQGNESLPAGWAGRRREVLQAHASLASADAAADAARELKVAFVALSEGRFHLVDVPRLIEDINQIVTLMENVSGQAEESE